MGTQFYNCGHAHKTQGNGEGKLKTSLGAVKVYLSTSMLKSFLGQWNVPKIDSRGKVISIVRNVSRNLLCGHTFPFRYYEIFGKSSKMSR